MEKPAIQHGMPLVLPRDYSTLPEMLIHTARQFPEQGIVYVDYNGKEESLSYQALLESSLRTLKALQDAGVKPGDHVLLEVDDHREFFGVFWACLLGGIVPAPVAQPTSYDANAAGFLKVRKIWDVLHHPLLLVDERNRARYVQIQQDPFFRDLKFLTTKDLQSSEAAPALTVGPEDTAFLQFSSGSTGTPKGVMLTHRNVIATVVAICNSVGFTFRDIICTWLPHTHDMGLIGQHLVAVSLGMRKVKLSPAGFVRSPLIFLEKVTSHRATSFCCPNFGLDWMVQKIPEDKLASLDLSSIRILFNGAEPISSSVMREFCRHFAPAGFSAGAMNPVYGLAEAALAVSVPLPGTHPLVHSIQREALVRKGIAVHHTSGPSEGFVDIVNEGVPVDGMSIRITDQANRVVEENVIGEIQISGVSVTKGYYNNPEANAASFVDGWFKTGDLGFLCDGTLVVNGRIKDIIFVRGQNYYAHDLEDVLHELREVPRGSLAVVGVFDERLQTEKLLAFVKHKGEVTKFLDLSSKVSAHLRASMGLLVDHVLPVNTIPKTTSGKVQRFELAKRYTNGEFDELIAEMASLQNPFDRPDRPLIQPATDLERAILTSWSRILERPEMTISTDDPFLEVGGTSVRAMQMLGELEGQLGRELGHEVLIRCKTVQEIAWYLEAEEKPTPEATSKPRAFADKATHDIAITGIAVRFPHADTIEEFWANLCAKKNSITPVSERRRALAGAPQWDDWMGELAGIELFDNDFFGINPTDASFMDPQQRLVLEVAYECLEDAGLAPYLDDEQEVGVYAGISQNGYLELVQRVLRDRGKESIQQGAMVGNMLNIIAASVSHAFNFTGPSMAIDTACSSFLVSLYQAVEALRSGRITGAVVLSSNLIITPTTHALSRKAGILSSINQCKVFDRNADGAVLGEGVVVLYLEALDQAVRDGKTIHSVIKGVGINNDGYSLGIMAPNPKGQSRAISRAYQDAGLTPSDVAYVETHGAGTTIGDPVEIRALDKVFREFPSDVRCGIGSVKSNIGHLLPAAGGAGLVKAILSLKNKKKVPTLFSGELNPSLELEKSTLYVVRDVEPWELLSQDRRRAGVSSFGFGGTNVHVVLEEFTGAHQQPTALANPDRSVLLTFSAKTGRSLDRLVDATLAWLEINSHQNLPLVAFTRNRFRPHFGHRKALVLTPGAEGSPPTILAVSGVHDKKRRARIGVFFDALDSRCSSIDHEIYRERLEFSRAFNEALRVLEASTGTVLEAEALLSAGPEQAKAPPPKMKLAVEFCRRYALGRLFQDLGIVPTEVFGTGTGELLAAQTAGLISLNTAIGLLLGTKPPTLTSFPVPQATTFFASMGDQRVDSLERLHQWMDQMLAEGSPTGFAPQGYRSELVIRLGATAVLPDKVPCFGLPIDGSSVAWSDLLELCARLYVNGAGLDWASLSAPEDKRMTPVPAYQFDRKEFWVKLDPATAQT